jgi:hypothetical protein
MSQRAVTPRGDFEARDRLSLAASGERLIFERVITNDRGERTVRQVFRKLGPHPSQRPPPEPLPSVSLVIGAYGYGDQAASSDRGSSSSRCAKGKVDIG